MPGGQVAMSGLVHVWSVMEMKGMNDAGSQRKHPVHAVHQGPAHSVLIGAASCQSLELELCWALWDGASTY